MYPSTLLSTLILISCLPAASAFIEGLYCGPQSCYDVLEVSRDATKQEITKAYRKLASQSHPDRVRGDAEAKDAAAKRFQVIATAYETLKDEDERRDYDYMLDNPDERYRHYWYYYRRRMTPKVDVRLVILGALVSISIVQYISARQKYNDAVSYLIQNPRYRLRATELARERGLLHATDVRKGKRKQEKEELKAQQEAVIREMIMENVDVQGGYRRPDLRDTLLVQLLFLPYTLPVWLFWHARFHWRHSLLRQEYDHEAKLYVIRRYLGVSQAAFDSLEEDKIETFLRRELWIWSNFKEYKEEEEEKVRQKQLESNAYKRYRRYMRQGGPGQMNVSDD